MKLSSEADEVVSAVARDDDVESTDVEEDDDMSVSFEDQPDLWQWRFKPGGERLAHYVDIIPQHMTDDGGSIADGGGGGIIRTEYEKLHICHQLAAEAKQTQKEFIYSKQQADLLQQEKELVRWSREYITAGL
eukprot:GHVS01097372.1.p1 GENE.GHVS01097372.1~~GHVS01097372.1.p1  ORF type:complete len:133 (+),score=39.59 GHVS01097372.1:643-1041(+)